MSSIPQRIFDIQMLIASMRPVRGDWRQRFHVLRHNYRMYAQAVDAGVVRWGYPCDPYIVGDWASLMTPIEAAMWDELRSEGLPFWPQFPVGKYMVDFGDPVRRIAIECDGKEFHQDYKKDARRDAEIESLGWSVHRISGRSCFEDEVAFTDETGFRYGLDFFRAGMKREESDA
jgi:very-short-patch-repair endonuclease